MRRLLFLAALAVSLTAPALAQQRIAHVDSEAILEQLPEFRSAQQEVERLATQYQSEVDALMREADELAQEFAARELLYTDQERQAKQAEIAAKKQEANNQRSRYFGPAQGELVRQQQQALRPIQERVLAAIETVAEEDGYDYVLDRAGEIVFLYAKSQHDLTERVLDELGVNTNATGASRGNL